MLTYGTKLGINMLAIEHDLEKIYSVGELNQTVRMLLEGTFSAVWIEGEISNLACPSSGHAYFTLKDPTAQIRCAMFSHRQRVSNMSLKNGLQVLVKAKISLYEARGDFQLIVERIEVAGDGKLQQAFEALKKKLAEEGLFAPEYKKPLPTFPKTIGIVTSPTGAAIRDTLSILKRRFRSIPVIIYPTLVQGQQASTQIAKAIAVANEHAQCDVLILTRGGGSLEDLWPFNEEVVARAIFASNIPIVSGVGHEIDFTIADFVSDLRAPTPSAAAELVSPDQAERLLGLKQSEQRLHHTMRKTIQSCEKNLEHLQKRLRHPREALLNRMQHLDQLEQTLIRVQSHFLQQKTLGLKTLSEKIDALSPLKILHRGYALITDTDERIVQSAKGLAVGDMLKTQWADGHAWSKVERL
jgi:exodeoxyribonuclease VII large subunit